MRVWQPDRRQGSSAHTCQPANLNTHMRRAAVVENMRQRASGRHTQVGAPIIRPVPDLAAADKIFPRVRENGSQSSEHGRRPRGSACRLCPNGFAAAVQAAGSRWGGLCLGARRPMGRTDGKQGGGSVDDDCVCWCVLAGAPHAAAIASPE
ncbi:hypothetical protein BC831DRAFT_443935 [Entophlyctis helioformis]|nr:hypothetical protein BC831DRAFT_443935 [Entophlyctis helioformis]